MSIIKYRQEDGTYIEMPSSLLGGEKASEIKLSEAINGLNATTIQNALASLQTNKMNSADLGSLKFRINDGVAQYSKDNGSSWAKF